LLWSETRRHSASGEPEIRRSCYRVVCLKRAPIGTDDQAQRSAGVRTGGR